MKIKILIVDDYPLFRSGLKLIIESHKNFKVIGEANNFSEMFNLLERQIPNVLLINLPLLEKNVLSNIKKLSVKYPGLPYVLLTKGATETVILECLNNGAHGMLWKEGTPEHLIETISTVAAGEKYLKIHESQITTKVIQHAYTKHTDIHDFSALSDRETEVLKLFADGFSYKEIGAKLYISPRTVESHKNNILTKLELNTLSDMIKYAIRHELIEL